MTARPRIDLHSAAEPRKFSNLVPLGGSVRQSCAASCYPFVFVLLRLAAKRVSAARSTIDPTSPLSLFLSLSVSLSATGTARSLFDNGVGRKLEGYHRWSNALTNYLTGRGLHGRDKQFMHRYSTADGPSVRRMRPLSSLRSTLSHLNYF